MLYAIYVIFGAALWATDTVFRHPLAQQFSAVTLVLCEHLIAVFFSFLFITYKLQLYKKLNLKKILLPWRSMVGMFFVGILGSALATICFTYSFHFVNPSVAILLQKTQPVFVIAFSSLFLSETLSKSLIVLSLLALLSAFFLSFPDGLSLQEVAVADIKGVTLALLAALFWAKSTVIGRAVLSDRTDDSASPDFLVTFWRFTFGLIGLIFLHFISAQSKIDIQFIRVQPEVMRSLFYMALIPGLIGVSLYYRGLSRIPASTATILELSFPLSAVLINYYFLGATLKPVQVASALVLLVTISLIAFLKSAKRFSKI